MWPRSSSNPPLEGLGADLPLLRRICGDDAEALDLLDRAVQRPAHVHANRDSDNVTINRIEMRGNSSSAALRRLRKDRPDLHELVIRGEKSPHAEY